MSGEGNLWYLNNGTSDGQLATYSELQAKAKSGNHFEITGNYSPNQCVKYSDLVVTTDMPAMDVDVSVSKKLSLGNNMAKLYIVCTTPKNANWTCKGDKDSKAKYFISLDLNGNSLKSGIGSSSFNIYLEDNPLAPSGLIGELNVTVEFTSDKYATTNRQLQVTNFID